MITEHIKNLRKFFTKAVESVKPSKLINSNKIFVLDKDSGQLLKVRVHDKTIEIGNKNVHIVGFGKAVLGMAVCLERILGTRLASGILSIPTGTLKQFSNDESMQLSEETNIAVYEGAKNNQPDFTAMDTAYEIKNLASQMTKDDILIVLISGGGSALLPMPKNVLSLVEKMELIKELANKGASIEEINCVRISLSDIKGGKLAAAARNAFAVISLIISDIIDDPVELIASGPTYKAEVDKFEPKTVLEKYEIWHTLPPHIKEVIEDPSPDEDCTPGANNSVHVIGNNKIAVKACAAESAHFGYIPVILSTSIQGQVQDVLGMYTCLIVNLKKYLIDGITSDEFRQRFPFSDCAFDQLLIAAERSKKVRKPLLLIMAGEPTVTVTGDGLGGRNQELALHMAVESYKNPSLDDICFLSAGTDGIDGPTQAAGAIGCRAVLDECGNDPNKTIPIAQDYLCRNDSYSFYHRYTDDEIFQVITGHTGTNVMDLHLLMLIPSHCNKEKTQLCLV